MVPAMPSSTSRALEAAWVVVGVSGTSTWALPMAVSPTIMKLLGTMPMALGARGYRGIRGIASAALLGQT